MKYRIQGPFRYWVHRHTFVPVDAHTTQVVDEVQAGLLCWTACANWTRICAPEAVA
jgi:ligand-binding SRPBCC domain-containing protein